MAGQLNFGKHKGKTLEWVFFNDPGYICWILDKNLHNDTYKFPRSLRERFDQLVRRAAKLKIPGLCSWCHERPVNRMFLTLHTSGGLATADFDCEKCHPPEGSSRSFAVTPSFLHSDFFRNYDKTGAKFLITAIKFAYFGNDSIRMTQKKMEEFFNCPDNFVDF